MLTSYRQLNIFEFESGESEDEEEWLGTNVNHLIRNLHGWMELLPLTVEEPQRLHKVKGLFTYFKCKIVYLISQLVFD